MTTCMATPPATDHAVRCAVCGAPAPLDPKVFMDGGWFIVLRTERERHIAVCGEHRADIDAVRKAIGGPTPRSLHLDRDVAGPRRVDADDPVADGAGAATGQ